MTVHASQRGLAMKVGAYRPKDIHTPRSLREAGLADMPWSDRLRPHRPYWRDAAFVLLLIATVAVVVLAKAVQ